MNTVIYCAWRQMTFFNPHVASVVNVSNHVVHSITMNSRGTLTIPMKVREKIGMGKGGMVIAEESDGGLILRPGRFFPVEIYSDERVKEFDQGDKKLAGFLKGKKAR